MVQHTRATTPEQVDYDSDFYAWALEQAVLLREHRFDTLDIENLAEEIEALARRDRRELKNRLAVLLAHLLKWQYQPQYPYKKSWRLTIEEQRDSISELLEESPSLKAELGGIIPKAYRSATRQAAKDTSLEVTAFPAVCPWNESQMLSSDTWPEANP